MMDWLVRLGALLKPGVASLPPQQRRRTASDVFGVLYSLPLVLLGLVWLGSVTDLSLYRTAWPLLLLILGLLFLLDRLSFFVHVEIREGHFSDWQESLGTMTIWSATLILGPIVLWVAMLYLLIYYSSWWRRVPSKPWIVLRNCTISLAQMLIAPLAALSLYGELGGYLPPLDFTLNTLLPLLIVTFILDLLQSLIWVPYFIFSARAIAWASDSPELASHSVRSVLLFWGTILAFNLFLGPFSVLATLHYWLGGLDAYLLFLAVMVLASYLTHRLSQAVSRSKQRSREVAKLEGLGRALLTAPPDADTLPQVLETHIARIFPYTDIEIRLFDEGTLLRYPENGRWADPVVWEWLRAHPRAEAFEVHSPLPWLEEVRQENRPYTSIVAPILEAESGIPIGGIYLARRNITETLEPIANLLPTVQSLTAQIASALQSAKVYRQTLAYQKVEQELALAGQIQASFLPHDLPKIPGWRLNATIIPARETSGDFYDVIPLSNGRWGIVIADVADKGTGAALYMALSRTLIRTYALQYYQRPDYVLKAANRRILMDTASDLFVTVFYGVLDPTTGTLSYANAGHNPPLLLSADRATGVQELLRTGMPLGILEGQEWKQKEVALDEGVTLVLYTDGIIDAEDEERNFFGSERLRQTVLRYAGQPPEKMQQGILEALRAFVGAAPQFDDITLVVLSHGKR
jgi:serine phosphatase RsbU (regulator of sigma subunit)/uncharacterized membrane protein